MTTDYGLRLDVCFSLAETLGRVHNEWRENAKLRLQTVQTTDYERRAKVNSTLNRYALFLSSNRRTAIQNVIKREACVQA